LAVNRRCLRKTARTGGSSKN